MDVLYRPNAQNHRSTTTRFVVSRSLLIVHWFTKQCTRLCQIV